MQTVEHPEFKVGITFAQQCELIDSPHKLESCVYKNEAGELYMFCQIGYAKFVFIALQSGNRADELVSTESPFEEESLKEALMRINEQNEGTTPTFIGRGIELAGNDVRITKWL